jgi:hypothetical protein
MAKTLDPKKKEAKQELVDLEVFKVDIVGSPATGDQFLQLRSKDPEQSPKETEPPPSSGIRRTAVSRGLAKQLMDFAVDKITSEMGSGTQGLEAQPVERQVPSADVDPEKKRAAQKKRAEKYGIETLENKGENLSYPKGDPTKETLYGDPVNLKYPLGKADNKVDKNRANNARTRFKQAFAVYVKKQSRAEIHNRIVLAQLKAGSSPSFDPTDSIDKLLSPEVKDKLQKTVERNEPDNGNSEKITMSTMDETMDRFAGLIERMESVFSGVLQAAPEGDATAPDSDGATDATEIQAEAPEGDATAPETDGAMDATEIQAEAPEGDATAPETDGTQELVDQAPNPAIIQMIEGIEKMGQTIERATKDLDKKMGEMTKQIKTIIGRVGAVERSIKIGGNAQPQDGTESVERSEEKSLWSNLL